MTYMWKGDLYQYIYCADIGVIRELQVSNVAVVIMLMGLPSSTHSSSEQTLVNVI